MRQAVSKNTVTIELCIKTEPIQCCYVVAITIATNAHFISDLQGVEGGVELTMSGGGGEEEGIL